MLVFNFLLAINAMFLLAILIGWKFVVITMAILFCIGVLGAVAFVWLYDSNKKCRPASIKRRSKW